MGNIDDFLNKFKVIVDREESKKEIILKIINKKTGKNINLDNLSIKNNTLFIKTNPYLKSEIILNKESIIKDIKKENIDTSIIDIR